jgi:branched-subunit amino acid transport protein
MIYLMIVAMGLVVFFNRYLFIEPRLPLADYFPG